MRVVLALFLVLVAGEAAAIDLGKALGGGLTAAKGMSISDDDVRAAADRACAWMDPPIEVSDRHHEPPVAMRYRRSCSRDWKNFVSPFTPPLFRIPCP